ncbi:MAG: prephenate dehydratase, partial [Actinobacteria bacterium]|nr:prephenate dehydratase [Actinomycetota bacterium]
MTTMHAAAPTVAYPGREGAHSAAACDHLFPEGADLVPLASFSAVAEAASEGAVRFGVLPIESSLSGPVAETHDLLYESPLSIASEAVLPIRHCLVGAASVRLEEIRIVRSHPAALDQCRRLLAAMPWATAIAAATTADAAADVAARGDRTEAAIASERAAHLHDLEVIVGDAHYAPKVAAGT